MSSQIQITGETKVKSLTGVLVGTSGVVSSLNIDGSLGIPQLDVNGKILVSQLPNSVMEYKGTWDASTNTPTLVNGTGNQGDVYLCSVAGTVNFGAGAIAFVVSDQVIYSGSIWQKASGTNGTVTSVGLSTNAGAITIGSSPITTSGTITANFNGTNLQYVNGAGNLTTFPTLITSIGLSMPSAFSVANSPLTANGTIAVTGAGVASQYIRGDGTLANFPTSGGGGSSVAYYFNSSVSQGTLGGVAYRELSKVPIIGAGTDITIATNGYIANYITDAGDPSLLEIPAGNWNFEMFFSASSGGGSPSFYVELYKYDGTTFTLISSSSATPEGITNGTAIDLYTTALAVPLTTLTLTDRLAIRVYVNNSGRTITLHTENSHLCEVITTFSTGIAALNGLTAQVQYFATGTSGTDFNISSSTATHTFNIPDASASARGLITTGTQTIAGVKTFSNGLILQYNYFPTPSTGDIGLGSNSSGITITTKPSTTVYNNTLQFSNGSNSFLFPNATGTLALTSDLSSYVPYTGATGNVDLGTRDLTSNGLISNIGIKLSQLAGYNGATGYTIINGTASGIQIRANNTNILNLYFPAANNDYTFPNATGTIALTSDLTSYVPYTGATGNVTLGTNTLSAGQITSIASSGGSAFTIINSANSRAWTLIPSTNGAESDLWLYYGGTGSGTKVAFSNGGNVGIGNTNPSYTLDVSGTGRFTSNIEINSSAANLVALTMSANSTGGVRQRFLNQAGSGVYNFQIGSNITTNNAFEIIPSTAADGTTFSTAVFKILNTGAATFSNGITVNGSNAADNVAVISAIRTDETGRYIKLIPSGNVGTVYGARIDFGHSSTNALFTGATYYNFSSNVEVGYSAVQGLYKLDVNGTGRFSGQVRFGTGLYIDTNGDFYQPYTGQIQISGIAANTTYPSYGFYGDTGLGMYRESADTLAFVTSAVKRLTITSTGAATFSSNVGIGGVSFSSARASNGLSISGSYSGITIESTGTTARKWDITANYSSGTAFLEFYDETAAAARMVINATGNVGIGTSSPNYSAFAAGITVLSLATSTTDRYSAIELVGNRSSGGNQNGAIAFINNNGTATVTSRITGTNTTGSVLGGELTFETKADAGSITERMRITSGGRTTIKGGTANSSDYALVVENSTPSNLLLIRNDGNIFTNSAVYNNTTATSANMFIFGSYDIGRSTSSARFKTQIEDIEQTYVNNIYNMKPKWYRSLCEKDNKDWSHFGFVAEEMAEIEPRLVHWFEEEDGTLRADGVQYDRITALLVKALQEQKNIIDKLSAKVTALDNTNISLQDRLDKAGL